MKSFCQIMSLLFFVLVAAPSFSQTVSSPTTQSEPPPSTDLDAAARYFEANFPATYEIIWSSPTPDIVKSSQVEIARVLIETFGHPSVVETLTARLEIEFPLLLSNAVSSTSEEWLRQGNVLVANVGQSVAEGLAVRASAALVTDLLFQTPPMRNTHPQLEGPLRIVVETTIIEMYDAQKALQDPSALLGKFLDRYFEIIEIYRSTLLVASTQKQALVAAVLAMETTAVAAVDSGGERGDEIIRRAIEYLKIAPMSQAVGADDGEAVDGILLIGLHALYAYHRGDEVLARQQAEFIRQLGAAGVNIHPFSAITKPLDWAITLINMGKDSSEIAAELLLGSTSLANLYAQPASDDPAPSQNPYSSLAEAEVYGEYAKIYSVERVENLVDSVASLPSGEVSEKFVWAASEVFGADIRTRNSLIDATYDQVMTFASGLENEERAKILIYSLLDQLAAEQGLTINEIQLFNDGRNINQSEIHTSIPELEYIDGQPGWELRPVHESVFHAYGYDPSDVRKYIHSAGCEYVFRRVSDGWEFLNDGVNTGTFNYSNRVVAHTLLDIFPWILWGVGAEEKRTFEVRLQLAKENGAASQIAARLQNALFGGYADEPPLVNAEKCGSRPGEPDIVWGSSELEASVASVDPNTLFVEAIAIYRDALMKSGMEQTADFEEVRARFDQIVEAFPETRQAQAIVAEAVPNVDFSLLDVSSGTSADTGFELGLEAGLYAIDSALCTVEATVGDAWGTLFQSVSASKVQRGSERDCEIETAEVEEDLVSVSARCSVEGETEAERWKWQRVSRSSFMETEGRHEGKSFSLCGSQPDSELRQTAEPALVTMPSVDSPVRPLLEASEAAILRTSIADGSQNPLLPGVYVNDSELCRNESVPHEQSFSAQRVVEAETFRFELESQCKIARTSSVGSTFLFRGGCWAGSEQLPGVWKLHVAARDQFVELESGTNPGSQELYRRCADGTPLQNAHGKLETAQTLGAEAVDTLPTRALTGDADIDAYLQTELPNWVIPSEINFETYPREDGGRISIAGMLTVTTALVAPVKEQFLELRKYFRERGFLAPAYLDAALDNNFGEEKRSRSNPVEYGWLEPADLKIVFDAELQYLKTVRGKRITSGQLDYQLPGTPLHDLPEAAYLPGHASFAGVAEKAISFAQGKRSAVLESVNHFRNFARNGLIFVDGQGQTQFVVTLRREMLDNAEYNTWYYDRAAGFNPFKYRNSFPAELELVGDYPSLDIAPGERMQVDLTLSNSGNPGGADQTLLELWLRRADGTRFGVFQALRWMPDVAERPIYGQNLITRLGWAAWPIQ